MPTAAHSRQAQAAQRFVEATRNVDLAFRAVRSVRSVRGNQPGELPVVEHATAVSKLDRALDELASAQEWFDSVVSVQTQ